MVPLWHDLELPEATPKRSSPWTHRLASPASIRFEDQVWRTTSCQPGPPEHHPPVVRVLACYVVHTEAETYLSFSRAPQGLLDGSMSPCRATAFCASRWQVAVFFSGCASSTCLTKSVLNLAAHLFGLIPQLSAQC